MTDIAICCSEVLADRGRGVRFPVTAFGDDAIAFVVRFDGHIYAYLNRCTHVPIELDWTEGEFFESGRQYLMCAGHGAIFLPHSGRCAGGPCRGAALRKISVVEKDGQVYWQPDEWITPRRA
ncbi:MAG: Rieske 2Fe-2S domain-containing protein [Burkholderiaceae bacterium]